MAARARRRRRGALLMEVMLALTIFIGGALAILAAMGQAGSSLASVRIKQQAMDLARSAMSRIEAGIESAETLNGPVPEWHDEEVGAGEFEDAPPAPTGWELSIKTTPFGTGELTMVEVTAVRRIEGRADPLGSVTLRQLVRLTPQAEDRVGELDEIGREAERAAEQPSRAPVRRRGGDGGSR